MPDVSIDDETLRIQLTVRERVLSLVDDEISIPRRALAKAAIFRDVLAELRGERRGAAIPGVLAIGTWSGYSGGREFADLVVVPGPGPGIVFGLTGQQWGRLLLGTEHPARLLSELNLAP